MDDDEFIRYVCPKCGSIYQFEECIVRSGTQSLSKRIYVAFKNRPQDGIELPAVPFFSKL